MKTSVGFAAAILALTAGAAIGCSSAPTDPIVIGNPDDTSGGDTQSTGDHHGTSSSNPTGNGEGGSTGSGNGSGGKDKPEDPALAARTVDYGEALRTASLKLLGALPPLKHIKELEESDDPKATYEGRIDTYFADARFQGQMVKMWKDIFRMGDDEGKPQGFPSRETAPTFAAKVTTEDRPYTDLLTADSNTCPTYDATNHLFVDGSCDNGVPTPAGVLTDPGIQWQFFGHMAFRRVRFIQEIFVCTKFPAEFADAPKKVNGADYTSPWPFASVATAPINFQDTSSVICANCHTSINHLAPLFGNFDDHGQFKAGIQVQTPTAPDPKTTEMTDWLQPGETTHWRFGEAVSDLPSLGQSMAADQDIADCAVTRAYNFVFSKGDAVSDLAFPIPGEIIDDYRSDFVSNGQRLKETMRAMFKSDDFVKF